MCFKGGSVGNRIWEEISQCMQGNPCALDQRVSLSLVLYKEGHQRLMKKDTGWGDTEGIPTLGGKRHGDVGRRVMRSPGGLNLENRFYNCVYRRTTSEFSRKGEIPLRCDGEECLDQRSILYQLISHLLDGVEQFLLDLASAFFIAGNKIPLWA